MSQIIEALIYATIAGFMIPLGGVLADQEDIRPRWLQDELRHSVIAFGGGVLVAAIAFVLVPEGVSKLPIWAIMLSFGIGGAVFAWLDHVAQNHLGPAGQLIAMLADFLP